MGIFWTRDVKQTIDLSGNNNEVWMINGAKFDISSVLNHTIENAVERFQNIIIANNPTIIINVMLILTIIILLIIFLYLRCRYQHYPSETNYCIYTLSNSVESSTSNDNTLSKNIPYSIGGYLV